MNSELTENPLFNRNLDGFCLFYGYFMGEFNEIALGNILLLNYIR